MVTTKEKMTKIRNKSNVNDDQNDNDVEDFSDKNGEHYINHEFQAVIYPINLMQAFFFLSKYSIRNNNIRPNGYIYDSISFLGILCFVLIQIYRSYTITAYYFDGTMQYITTVFSCLLYAFNYVVYFIDNILNKNNNVEVIRKTNKAHRFLKSIRDENLSSIKIWNWAILLLSFVINFVFIAIHARVMNQDCELLSYIFLYTLSEFDMSMLHARCVLHLITSELNIWIKEIESYSELCVDFRVARNYVDREHYWKKLFEAYLDLMEAYKVFQRIIQVPVLVQVITVFLHSLLYLQIFIELEKKQIFVNATMHVYTLEFIIAMWTLKTMVCLAIFSVACEKLYSAASKADMLATNYVVFKISEQCGRLCKNLHRAHAASFRRLSACGVFALDGALIRKLVALLVSYSVVLLQFALDKRKL